MGSPAKLKTFRACLRARGESGDVMCRVVKKSSARDAAMAFVGIGNKGATVRIKPWHGGAQQTFRVGEKTVTRKP